MMISFDQAAASLPAPEGLAKMVLQTHRDERGNKLGIVAGRADDGFIIGSAFKGVLRFGHSDMTLEHYYLDQNYAEQALKRVCRLYLDRMDVDFMTQDAPDIIIVGPVAPQSNHGRRQ